MIASSTPPRRHGPWVMSKHMLSRKRWSMPYCLALRIIPGTMSLPFSACQRKGQTQRLCSHFHSPLPRNWRASMSDPMTREPQCATPYRHEPVPTKGSYMTLPGAGWRQLGCPLATA